jgi:hypothetical protein
MRSSCERPWTARRRVSPPTAYDSIRSQFLAGFPRLTELVDYSKAVGFDTGSHRTVRATRSRKDEEGQICRFSAGLRDSSLVD